MKRMVIVTADTLAEILKDYLGEGNIPRDAQVVGLLVKPSEQGRFALRVESPEIVGEDGGVVADFAVKRFYGVGSGVVNGR